MLREILAGWIIFQLFMIGVAGYQGIEDEVNCVAVSKTQAYTDVPLILILLPIAYFTTEDRIEVTGCPETLPVSPK